MKKDTLKNENQRFQNLLGLITTENIPSEFNLGKIRSLKDYQNTFGIDFKNKTLTDLAKTGNFENIKNI